MAIASKKSPRAKPKRGVVAPATKRRVPKHGAAEDTVHEPDRSAPSLAEVDADALEFIAAIDRFKKQHARPFPSWSEVLLVLRQLGYRRS